MSTKITAKDIVNGAWAHKVSIDSRDLSFRLGKHISGNFYHVSDASAGTLARNAGVPLPKSGYEIEVRLPNGQKVWLTRTPTRHTPGFENKRGWVWAVHSTERIER